jgi:NTE family protein
MTDSSNAQLSDPGWALILPGGGNRGAIQAGALLALFERGFAPELIVGVSAGAINGSYLAFHPSLDGVHEIHEIWRSLTARNLFGTRIPSVRRLWALAAGRTAAFKNDGMEHLLVKHLPSRQFENTTVPLVVIATHLETGTARALDSGDLVKAVLASAALPSILPPVAFDGELLVDGGIADPTPIHVATERGFTRVMVVEPGYSCACPRVFESAQSILGQSLAIMARARFDLELAANPRSVELVHLGLTCDADRPITDFSATNQMIASGRSEAALKLNMQFPEPRSNVLGDGAFTSSDRPTIQLSAM